MELWAPTRKLVFGPTLYMAPISGDLHWEIFFGAPCGSWVWMIQMRKFAKQKSQFSENMCTETFIWRHLKMFLDLVCLKKSVMLFYYNWFRLPPKKQIWKSWLLLRVMVFVLHWFSSEGMLLGMVSTSFCSGRHVALCLSLHSHRCEIGFWENFGKKVRFVEDVWGFTGMPL